MAKTECLPVMKLFKEMTLSELLLTQETITSSIGEFSKYVSTVFGGSLKHWRHMEDMCNHEIKKHKEKGVITKEMIKDFKSGETILIAASGDEWVFIGESMFIKDKIFTESEVTGVSGWHLDEMKNWTVKKKVQKIVFHAMLNGDILISIEGSDVCKARDGDDLTIRINVDLSKMEMKVIKKK